MILLSLSNDICSIFVMGLMIARMDMTRTRGSAQQVDITFVDDCNYDDYGDDGIVMMMIMMIYPTPRNTLSVGWFVRSFVHASVKKYRI